MNTHPQTEWLRSKIAQIPWKMVQTVLLAFFLTRAMIFIVTYASMAELPVKEGDAYWRAIPQNIVADALVRWDGGFYRDIIRGGYQSVSEGRATVFFPFYPLLVWSLYKITGHLYLSGLLISNLMFFVALFYLYAFIHQEHDDDTAGRAVFYVAAAPTAFIFSAFYTESTFLALFLAGFYYARNQRWVLAGILGALASATRVTGVAVALFYLFEGWWQQGVRFRPSAWTIKDLRELILEDFRLALRAWQSALAALGSLLGILAYMLYLYKAFGDPLAFIHNQSFWARKVTGNWLSILWTNTYNRLNLGGDFWAGQINVNLLQDVVAIVVFIPLIIAVFIKLRPGFGVFSIISFLIPLMSASIISMRRYILVLIPCFIILALWGKRAWVDRAILIVSLPLQAYLTILFTHWYFAG